MLRTRTAGGELFADLFGSLTPDELVREYWARKPLCVRGGRAKFAALMSVARFRELVRTHAAVRILCSMPDDGHRVALRHGIRPIVELRPEQVDAMLAAGGTITLDEIERADEGVAAVASALKAAVSYAGPVHASCWLSPPGSGVPVHFDGRPAVTMQVEGRKSWRVSRRPAIEWPNAFAISGSDGRVQYIDDEATAVADWKLDVEPADDSEFEEYVLEPGDLLLIPGGTWHTTRAVDMGPSLAINLSFGPARPLDLLTEILERRLAPRASWRHLPAVAPASGGAMPAEIRRFLAERLAELRAELDRLADDEFEIHAAWKSRVASGAGQTRRGMRVFAPPARPVRELQPSDRVQFSTMSPVTYAEGRTRDGQPILRLFHGEHEVSFEAPELIPFAVELAARRSFRASEAQEWSGAAHPYTWDHVKELLEALLEARVLIYCAPS